MIKGTCSSHRSESEIVEDMVHRLLLSTGLFPEMMFLQSNCLKPGVWY